MNAGLLDAPTNIFAKGPENEWQLHTKGGRRQGGRASHSYASRDRRYESAEHRERYAQRPTAEESLYYYRLLPNAIYRC